MIVVIERRRNSPLLCHFDGCVHVLTFRLDVSCCLVRTMIDNENYVSFVMIRAVGGIARETAVEGDEIDGENRRERERERE